MEALDTLYRIQFSQQPVEVSVRTLQMQAPLMRQGKELPKVNTQASHQDPFLSPNTPVATAVMTSCKVHAHQHVSSEDKTLSASAALKSQRQSSGYQEPQINMEIYVQELLRGDFKP